MKLSKVIRQAKKALKTDYTDEEVFDHVNDVLRYITVDRGISDETQNEVTFEELKGKTITSIYGLEKGSEKVVLSCKDGSEFQMSYYHDCCASCEVEDIIGDPGDLIGNEILLAEEVISNENPEGVKPEYQESFTWTFYKLSTIKGSVTVRWYGASNGYYSESVTFERS